MRENVPAGEIIFLNSWDYSLVLFYLDDTHYYLFGLDPTFMYDYDKQAYELWQDLVIGKEKDISKIESVFKSRTIIIDMRITESKKFIENLKVDGKYKQVFENEWLKVFTSLQ